MKNKRKFKNKKEWEKFISKKRIKRNKYRYNTQTKR